MTASRPHRIAACFLAAAALGGCGIELAAPETTVHLHVEGTVLDSETGAPIAGARVALARLWYGWTELTSVQTDSEGRYSLSYVLRHVATDEEFGDDCTVWHDDTGKSVGLVPHAPGYLWGSDGSDGSPRLRCTNGLQIIDLRMVYLE